jgi:DinB superfamily
MDIGDIVAELRWAAADFRRLVDDATVADLRRGSDGTKWSNEQLLFHMLFGYLLVRNLMLLVRVFNALPDSCSRRFAALLNAGTRPFHVVNYVGSLGGARALGNTRMERVMDAVVAGLVSRLQRESAAALERRMHFPVGWDPYFRDVMTRAEVYHYATEHYRHHRAQLTLTATRPGRPGPVAGLA